jgi:ATP-binding cassette, subfamily G (WHITE), member 1
MLVNVVIGHDFKLLNGFNVAASKQVLKSISGIFKSSELTAVIGPSGCGKSSLLNILSGYVTKNVSGDIEVKDTRKRSYIMQEENLHLLLTVIESVMFSINVKTGFKKLKVAEKKLKVNTVLANLGLEDKINAYVRDLSGGQLKRLSIAQEIVDDPSILFLDEPTTGLDSSSSTQCIKLLKTLAQEGKTVVCTIHTPSALIFKQFDHLYTLAGGKCIYQGCSLNLMPFLNELGLVCPETYNPSDFLIEIANGEYGLQNDFLTEKIMNGKNEQFRREESSSHVICQVFDMSPSNNSHVSSNFIEQLWYLMIRNSKIIYRDKTIMWLRLAIHIVVALSVGAFFVNVGPEASKIFSNFKMIYATTMFLMYTGFYSSVTRFSLEMSTTSIEIFNKCYSTAAYYWAICLTDIPLTVVCTTIFVQIVFTMTGQPNQPGDEFRFTMLLSLQIFVSFLASGFGQMIGSLFSLMVIQIFNFHLHNFKKMFFRAHYFLRQFSFRFFFYSVDS